MQDSIAAGMGCIDKGVGELKGVALVCRRNHCPGWHTHSAACCLHETVLLQSTLPGMPIPCFVPACRIGSARTVHPCILFRSTPSVGGKPACPNSRQRTLHQHPHTSTFILCFCRS